MRKLFMPHKFSTMYILQAYFTYRIGIVYTRRIIIVGVTIAHANSWTRNV